MGGHGSPVELFIHSVDGHVSRFVVEGAAGIRELVERVQPARIFAQPHIVVGSSHSLSVFPCASVVRVDVVTDGFPDWAFPYGATDIHEISAEEFVERYQTESYSGMKPAEGAPIVRFGEIELASGQRVFLEVHAHVETRLPVELGMLLQQILSAPSMYARRRGGGVVFVNPANIVRFTFHPGPESLPPNAVAAEPLSTRGGSELVLLLDE